MKLLIVTPAPKGSTKGNRITAERWAGFLQQLGRQVHVFETLTPETCRQHAKADALIALHARKSADSVALFQERFPGNPVLVALTGTDLHDDLEHSPVAQRTLQNADRLILLEPEGIKKLPLDYQAKAVVIYQSAERLPNPPKPNPQRFEITVIGHLRAVKDPFRAAISSRDLPEDSRIQILHIGAALSETMQSRAKQETATNARYLWKGGLSHQETQQLLARSRLTVLTSQLEGAPSVISEAIVADVPVLMTRIPAAIGMLGEDYPGLFPVGDTKRLTQLMLQAEQDQDFYQSLRNACNHRKHLYTPERELESWRLLLKGGRG